MTEFQRDVADIVELEEDLRLIHDGLRGEDWVQDRIRNLRFLYKHLERHYWPIIPGRGTPQERGIDADHQERE